jgi:hypothetical protein
VKGVDSAEQFSKTQKPQTASMFGAVLYCAASSFGDAKCVFFHLRERSALPYIEVCSNLKILAIICVGARIVYTA